MLNMPSDGKDEMPAPRLRCRHKYALVASSSFATSCHVTPPPPLLARSKATRRSPSVLSSPPAFDTCQRAVVHIGHDFDRRPIPCWSICALLLTSPVFIEKRTFLALSGSVTRTCGSLVSQHRGGQSQPMDWRPFRCPSQTPRRRTEKA